MGAMDNYILPSLVSKNQHRHLKMVPTGGRVGAWCRSQDGWKSQGESRSWVRGCPSNTAGTDMAVGSGGKPGMEV